MARAPQPEKAARPCEWRQVAANEYRRPLFANEIFLAIKSSFDGTCTMISSFTITGASMSVVEGAWIQMAMLQPLLRMRLHKQQIDGKLDLEFSYTVPERPQEALQAWSQRTFKPSSKMTRHDLQERAIEGRNELCPQGIDSCSDVAHLYASEDSKGIHFVFAFQHAITDARGQWMMIDLFLQLCSGELSVDPSTYQWGRDDIAKLPRPFHYAANLRKDGDKPPFDALEMVHKHIEEDTHLVPFAGFPVREGSSPSTAVSKVAPIRYLSIKADDYQLLHVEAKRNDITASAWVGAVLTLLMYELNTTEDAKTIRFPLLPVDARRLMASGSPPYFGVAIGGGNVDMKEMSTISRALSEMGQPGSIPSSFWEVAHEYKAGLEKLTDAKDSVLAAKEVLELICPFVLADSKIGDMSSVFYTSLGRAKSYFTPVYGGLNNSKQVVLEDLVTFPLFHNTLLLMCALMEFKGDLKICYQIPTNTHHQFFAETFAARFEDLIARLISGVGKTVRPPGRD